MGYWATRGLRGSSLEEIINRTNKEYFEDDLAVIQKIPTSIKPVEINSQKGIITLAYFDTKSTVDYVGNVQGIPICFDAKQTLKESLPIANIHPHQMAFMNKFNEQGGLSFLIVSFDSIQECYLLTLETLNKYWQDANDGGRKSIPLSAFDKNLRIRRSDNYLLHYLEAVSIYFNMKEKEDK